MASRLDAIQNAVNRAPDTAAQTHAAQRQPVIAQEQVTATNKQAAAAREQRPAALARRAGREVKNDLVAVVQGRDQEPGRQTRKRRPPVPVSGSNLDSPDETTNGKGNLLDLRV